MRRNAILWKDFYEDNYFCEHITLENGEKMPRNAKLITQNNKPSILWLCDDCFQFQEHKIEPVKLLNNDKGKDIDDIDI
tara:strand:+ start:4507 stop:4743 length:237 start_codon:yes stop_codon:yes gene_type:complete